MAARKEETEMKLVIAEKPSVAQSLAKVLGADSLRFLSVDDLKQACGCQGLCTACFDGSYVTPLYSNKV